MSIVDTRPARPRSPARWVVLTFGGLFAVAMILGGVWALMNLVGQVTEERQFTVAPGGSRLVVRTGGDVRVERGASGMVGVHEQIRHGFGRPRVEVTPTADGVEVRGGCPWYSSNCSISLVLTVPPDMSVDVRTSAGDITVNGGTAPVLVQTSSGDVDGAGLQSGQLEARTSAGDIAITFDTAPDRVVLHSSAGDVELGLPGVDGAYRVNVHTGSGDQDVSIPTDPESRRAVDVDTSAGDVTLRPS